jgi:hypothetical protein
MDVSGSRGSSSWDVGQPAEPVVRSGHADPRPSGHNRDVNFAARILLLVWVFGYLFAACAPILNGHLILGAITLVGGIFFFPIWVIGIVVLAGVIWLTNRRA